jgi:hypothetical protein
MSSKGNGELVTFVVVVCASPARGCKLTNADETTSVDVRWISDGGDWIWIET